MNFVRSNSLAATLDAVNDAWFTGRTIGTIDRLAITRWIASRLPEGPDRFRQGSYRGMPAPTEIDFAQGIRLFTGEHATNASARHIAAQGYAAISAAPLEIA